MFIVWNIGQGLWTTAVSSSLCEHYDVGGETFHAGTVLRNTCNNKKNRVHFTHWDLDHINLVGKLLRWLPHACLETPPSGYGTLKKQLSLQKLPMCNKSRTNEQKQHHHELKFISDFRRSDSNSLSRIFISHHQVLIPGDSSTTMENIWIKQLGSIQPNILVLGHHGSKTSTGEALLKRLTPLRLSISSSRIQKYGHPHKQVIHRLHKHSVPMIRTEDWGHIAVQLKRNGRYSIPKSRATGS